ncbi:MAG: hypothetical protein ABJG78_08080 [Cyclobacteriaceae bacterium]
MNKSIRPELHSESDSDVDKLFLILKIILPIWIVTLVIMLGMMLFGW